MQRAPGYLLFGALILTSLLACDSGSSVDTSAAASTLRHETPVESRARALPAAAASSIKPDAVKNAVAHVIQVHYEGGYDEANRCWRAERGEGDEAAAYCMRLLPEHVVQYEDGAWVYVALASASDIRNHPDYLYGHVDAGVMDVFKLRIGADGAPEVLAHGLGLSFGSAGDCGCANAKFMQVGPSTHGWMFTSGGTWQGQTIASHALVAPVGDVFKDVAGIPRYREADQDVEYRIAVDAKPGRDAWYPLRVMRYRAGHKDGERVVAFDPGAQRYVLPGDF